MEQSERVVLRASPLRAIINRLTAIAQMPGCRLHSFHWLKKIEWQLFVWAGSCYSDSYFEVADCDLKNLL
jgi:hypothetical protein